MFLLDLRGSGARDFCRFEQAIVMSMKRPALQPKAVLSSVGNFCQFVLQRMFRLKAGTTSFPFSSGSSLRSPASNPRATLKYPALVAVHKRWMLGPDHRPYGRRRHGPHAWWVSSW